jgi:hypothetical protein
MRERRFAVMSFVLHLDPSWYAVWQTIWLTNCFEEVRKHVLVVPMLNQVMNVCNLMPGQSLHYRGFARRCLFVF